jgi:hypothetical protein
MDQGSFFTFGEGSGPVTARRRYSVVKDPRWHRQPTAQPPNSQQASTGLQWVAIYRWSKTTDRLKKKRSVGAGF